MTENEQPEPSYTERRIRRLVVPEPSGFAQNERIDWIHDPDRQLLDPTEGSRAPRATTSTRSTGSLASSSAAPSNRATCGWPDWSASSVPARSSATSRRRPTPTRTGPTR